MYTLALDTCDSRGSLAILRDEEILQVVSHQGTIDYSSWILPTAQSALSAAGLKMPEIGLLAAASGPGSFTGVRVGLTTVKAWAEVYGLPIAAVPRLQAIAWQAPAGEPFVAAFVDAHRSQVFGALYRRSRESLLLVGEEMVIAPREFVEFVSSETAGDRVSWVSLDPEMISGLDIWPARASSGETIARADHVLAPAIGRIGSAKAKSGQFKDPLTLDAEYVRRSDAEIFWKGAAKSSA